MGMGRRGEAVRGCPGPPALTGLRPQQVPHSLLAPLTVPQQRFANLTKPGQWLLLAAPLFACLEIPEAFRGKKVTAKPGRRPRSALPARRPRPSAPCPRVGFPLWKSAAFSSGPFWATRFK